MYPLVASCDFVVLLVDVLVHVGISNDYFTSIVKLLGQQSVQHSSLLNLLLFQNKQDYIMRVLWQRTTTTDEDWFRLFFDVSPVWVSDTVWCDKRETPPPTIVSERDTPTRGVSLARPAIEYESRVLTHSRVKIT